jgi:alpha-galactosidase
MVRQGTIMTSKRIVLVGAGSAQFGLGTVADILSSKVLGEATIVLHDINPESLEMIRKVCQMAIDEKKLNITLEAATSRTEALKGADFVIISIEVGDRFKLWEQDYQIPLKFGNKQVFGENGGPGGLFHALRIIPSIIEICGNVEKTCPNAWVINLSNPMSRICLAIKRKFNGRVKAIGLCHEIDILPEILPRMLKTPFSNLHIKAAGLNHFGVLLEATYKDTGKDAYPDIRKRAPNYIANFQEVGLIKEIIRIYGVLPYTTDSHFGEYIQWAWEVADNKGIREFYERVKAEGVQSKKMLKRIVEEKKPSRQWLIPSGERVIPIIEGIITDSKQYELSVNLPNNGIVDNLPQDIIVECPATADKNGVHGVSVGSMPSGLAALMKNQAIVQDLCVEAALMASRKKALEALLADPAVDSLSSAEKMLDEIMQLQKEWLGYLE